MIDMNTCKLPEENLRWKAIDVHDAAVASTEQARSQQHHPKTDDKERTFSFFLQFF